MLKNHNVALPGEPPIPEGYMRLRSAGDPTQYVDEPAPVPIPLTALTEQDREYLRSLGIDV